MKTAKALIALLALACAVLLCAHVRMPRGTRLWRLPASAACARSGQRMAVSRPAGDVDVNRATAAELDALFGVGPVLAQQIIAEREANGAFYYPEDLLNVKGIGEKTLERMQKQLKLP